MSASAWALQKAIYTVLTGDAALTSLCGGCVYDKVPQDAVFPYIVIGEASETAAGAGLTEHSVTLHLWSRYSGACEIKSLGSAIRTALDGVILPLDGHVMLGLMVLSADYLRQSDGETWRGSLRLRAVTEAV